MTTSLENDGVLKAAKLLCNVFRWVLIIAAVIAGLISAGAAILFVVQLIDPSAATNLFDEAIHPVAESGIFAVLLAVLCAALVLSAMFLKRLLEIIHTVGNGDPFVDANAIRLQQMGTITLIIFAISCVAAGFSLAIGHAYPDLADGMSVDVSFESILLALILFILARVFRHGAAMRDDLEGTV